MKKWVYDRIVEEYSKLSTEELILNILSLQEIETSDRVMAHECFSGMDAFNILSLISTAEKVQNALPEKEQIALSSAIDQAKESWKNVCEGLEKMNNPSRCSENLESFKNRVSKATDSEDSI